MSRKLLLEVCILCWFSIVAGAGSLVTGKGAGFLAFIIVPAVILLSVGYKLRSDRLGKVKRVFSEGSTGTPRELD